jgi:hypothetical protein
VNVPVKRTSTLAIVSLVSGILGWSLVPWIGSLVAIITGHMARAEIRRESDTVEGDGLAIAGLVLGWGAIAATILLVVLVFMFFGGLALFLAWMGASGNLH